MKLDTARALAGAAVVAAAWGSGALAQDQSVEDFYRGKTVTMQISAAPGGSSDFFGRQLAQFYGRHIPGNPDVVVENVVGAGGMVAAAQLQKSADADGTVLGFLQRNNLYQSLLDGDDFFDPREVRWIGSVNSVFYTIAAWQTSPVQTAEEMFTTEMVLGATGWDNENRTLPALMNEHLGTKFNIIHGYTGSEEVGIAMERGEVDGKAATMNNLIAGNEAEWIKEGKLKVLMQMGWENHPAFPDVPNFTDYVPAEDTDLRSMIDFIILPFESGRPLAVPGGVPEDRVEALRRAFDATMTDPEFIAHMEQLNSDLDPVTGERVEEIVDTIYQTPPAVLEDVRTMLRAES